MGVVTPEANLFATLRRRQARGSLGGGSSALGGRREFQQNLAWAQRYELAAILKGHQGCVNTIQWSPDGQVLCSGSDDRNVNLWRFDGCQAGRSLIAAGSFATLHRHNIFDAQLTLCQRRVVSCGADGCVCITDLEAPPSSQRRMLYEPDTGHFLASKIAFAPLSGPEVFLVTFGDGRARLFDLRQSDREHSVAVDAAGVGLTGIHVNPGNAMELAIGGSDPFLRLYDLRAISSRRSSPAASPTPVISLHTSQTLLDPSLRRRKGLRGFWTGSSDVGISGVCWSSNGRSLLANFRGADVLLFDMVLPTMADGKEGTGKCSEVTLPAEACEECSLPTDKVRLNVVQAYVGRANEQTCAKEVRFFYGDAAVATGGDCGHVFIWDTSSGCLLRKLPADRCVVNCLAPHPSQPLACTSGIDSEIKVWDVGDDRVRCTDGGSRKRGSPQASSSQDFGTSSDWGRRRREAAPNVTPAEAEEKLKNAERSKQRGNSCVKQADYEAALERYKEALQELHIVAPNAETGRELQALQNGCRLNCALCHLALQEFGAAVEECSKVLDDDATNVKARFRRASALGELNEFERAFEDIDMGLAAEPSSSEMTKLRAKLQKQHAKHRKRELDVYKRMFSSSGSASR